MNDLNNNIKFNYLYRDAGNYKEFGEFIFTNQGSQSLQKIELAIRNCLIEKEFFIPEKWNIPRLNLGGYSPELDHDYHEFESIEITSDSSTENCDISLFLMVITNSKANSVWQNTALSLDIAAFADKWRGSYTL